MLQQTNTTIITMDPTTEKMIRELADKLGTTVEHLWGVLVRQAVVSSAVQLTLFALALLALIPWTIKLVRSTFGDDPAWSSEDVVVPLWAITGIVWLVCLIFTLIWIPTAITTLINPEYWAFKQIVPY